MAKVIFNQESKKAAFGKMNEFGFSNYGRVGFTDFSIQKNAGLDEVELERKYWNNEPDEYSIVATSSYHCEDTIREQYETSGKNWAKS